MSVVLLAGCSAYEGTGTIPSTAVEPPSDSTTVAERPVGDDAATKPVDVEPEFVIDVRSESEWKSGHVEQAVHIPHTEIVDRISEVTDDKNAKIVVYCAVGGRAGKAKTALEELGFTNVENAGGYDDVKTRYE